MFILLLVFFLAAAGLACYQAIECHKEGRQSSTLINCSLCLAFVGLALKLTIKPLVPIPDGVRWLTAPLQAATPTWAPDALGWAAVALLATGVTLRIRDWTGRQDEEDEEDEDDENAQDDSRPTGERGIKTDQ